MKFNEECEKYSRTITECLFEIDNSTRPAEITLAYIEGCLAKYKLREDEVYTVSCVLTKPLASTKDIQDKLKGGYLKIKNVVCSDNKLVITCSNELDNIITFEVLKLFISAIGEDNLEDIHIWR